MTIRSPEEAKLINLRDCFREIGDLKFAALLLVITCISAAHSCNLKRQGGKQNVACWEFSQIDNLAYTYNPNSNRLRRITDSTGNNKGFKPNNASATDYSYDANGNMKADPFKGIANINYNHQIYQPWLTLVRTKRLPLSTMPMALNSRRR
jgi:hypothetical protein